MSVRSINPLLISLLSGESLNDIPAFPSISNLPGKHVKFVNKNLGKIDSPHKATMSYLVCGNCNKKAKYNVGFITINAHKFNKDAENIDNHIQTTGYFRCKGCNSASAWQLTSEFKLMITVAVLTNSVSDDDRLAFGENRLYDGSVHRYATDAEEYLLQKISESEDDAFIWNRLGNLYFKGNRADLAVVAFERSLELDPMQTESLFSLGSILLQVGKKEEALIYYYKTLLSACDYQHLDALPLRDLLTNVLHDILYMYFESDRKISIIPPIELIRSYRGENIESDDKTLERMNFDISPDDFESFYPIAEMYMRDRKLEIPKKKRTFKS